MEDLMNVKRKRAEKTKQVVLDFVSYFEQTYGIQEGAKEDFLLGEEAEEQIIYNWNGDILSDLTRKGGVNDAVK
ncbi:MAG: hypothetical protein K6G11_08980 [Lachnospiraceae bacterium]|nr:hypothetical protein [Lachnospiraceae bacterium]